MRILVVADYLPYPLIGGDRIRIYNLLRRVASQHEVALATFLEAPEDADGVHDLRQFCVRVETARLERRGRLVKALEMLRYAMEGKPPELRLLYSEELAGKIRNLVSALDFDIVQIEHSRMGLYLKELPTAPRRKSIWMLHNITFAQHRRVFRVETSPESKARALLSSLAMRRWEPRFAARFDRCTVVSQMDRNLLLNANPRLQVDVVPNGVDTRKYQLLPADLVRPGLLFIGNMAYPPCADAARYFCREILPRIRKGIEAVEVWIIGRNPSPDVLQLSNECVHVTGRVDDIIPYYRQAAVCIVPLRAGGGTRLKILEAMALGRPVVSTTIGCEGLEVVGGDHLLIADDPLRFADETLRLLLDRQLYATLRRNARMLVESEYDWDKVAERLSEVYVRAMTAPVVRPN